MCHDVVRSYIVRSEVVNNSFFYSSAYIHNSIVLLMLKLAFYVNGGKIVFTENHFER